MPYYFVCDGGGSKTESLLFNEKGVILAAARGEGANALFLPPEQAGRRVLDQLERTLQKAGLRKEQLDTAALFIPGFKPCEPMLRAALPLTVRLQVTGDELNAFYGALGRPRGIAVLSGTGSFAIGRAGGGFVTAGGWGPVMGDEGSGYHIGSLCLRRLARLADEGKNGTRLEQLVLQALGQPDVLGLRGRPCRPDFDRAAVAALCPLVAQAAGEGDAAAADILRTAAAELARLAHCVARHLGDETLPVVLIGGVAKAGPVFTGPFRRQVAALLPRAECREPAYTPALGAVLCVLSETAGADIDDPALICNIRKGMGGTVC